MDGNAANQPAAARHSGGRLGALVPLRPVPSSLARGTSVLRPARAPQLVAARRGEDIWRGKQGSRRRTFVHRARCSSFHRHPAPAFVRRSGPLVRSSALAWNSSLHLTRNLSCQHSSCHGQRSRSCGEDGASRSAVRRMGFPTMECYRYTSFALTLRAGPPDRPALSFLQVGH
jgi:hypothetical protein